MKRMSSSARRVLGSQPRRSRPRAARRARVRVELVVDREVREVEEAVAHARVLPVDDPEPLAVVEEVRVQEVVVARHRRARRPRRSRSAARSRAPSRTPRGSRRRARAPSRGRPRRRGRSRSVPGIAGPSWNARSAAATRASIVRLAHPLERRDRALDEARDEPALGLDERRRPPGPTPTRRRRLASPRARRSGRSRAGRCPSRRRGGRSARRRPRPSALWFVMPPPSTSNASAATRPDALDRGRRSSLTRGSARPSGRRAARSATTPATHSPKISTATSVPTSCSAGRYAYAIDLLDRVAVPAARHPADELAADAHRLRAERDRARVVERQAAEQALGLVARRRAPRGR